MKNRMLLPVRFFFNYSQSVTRLFKRLYRFIALSLYRFIALSLYRFIALSLYRFIALSLLL
ncbi:hypothetical protein GT348_07800 [Aristophania vespae]|uniref:Uncharacterized protein n=1 Tax=Aristophania vespae TaxID=2697033 RepID=A0A6P1NFC5_9PROT|nr:hypothetical protein [Aristophania vespae]QHI96148.1 hypothetical protein GT348_07800 [Aristophania vespae]